MIWGLGGKWLEILGHLGHEIPLDDVASLVDPIGPEKIDEGRCASPAKSAIYGCMHAHILHAPKSINTYVRIHESMNKSTFPAMVDIHKWKHIPIHRFNQNSRRLDQRADQAQIDGRMRASVQKDSAGD